MEKKMCEMVYKLPCDEGTEQYRSYMDGAGKVFINLTPNSIILNDFANRVVIPQSGHILRVILRSTIQRISGIPCSRKGVFFIVETAVKSCVNRPDFCVSVELDPLKEGVVLIPIEEMND